MGIPVNPVGSPQPCCTPDQWEGIISGFAVYKKHWYSRAQLDFDLFYFSYDKTNQRIAMNGTVYNRGKQNALRVIERYDEKKIYIIDGEGKCKSKDLTVDFMPACIPEKATYNGRWRQGLGDESIEEDSWMYEYMGYNGITNVTPQQCIPFSETVWGMGEGFPRFAAVGYVEITAGIKSPSIFTPPKDCPTGDVELEGLMLFIHNKISAQ